MRKRRLLRSLFWGALLPVCYTLIAGPISAGLGEGIASRLLYLPIGWPRHLYYSLLPLPALMRFGDLSFFVFMVVCDVALYTSLAYLALWALSLRRRATAALSSPPPPPPDFGEGRPPGDPPTTTTAG